MDREDIILGKPYKPELNAALDGCQLLVAIMNTKFESSCGEFGCLAELRRARERGIPIVPLCADTEEKFYPTKGGELEALLRTEHGDLQRLRWTPSNHEEVGFIYTSCLVVC